MARFSLDGFQIKWNWLCALWSFSHQYHISMALVWRCLIVSWIAKTKGGCVIKNDGCGCLWEPHFFEGQPDGDGFFAVVKCCSYFTISCG